MSRRDGTQINFAFTAANDGAAFAELTRLFNLRYPRNRRPLAGESYIHSCRRSLRPAKSEVL